MFQGSLLALYSVCLAFADAQNFPVPTGDGTSGSGKYPASYMQDASFKGYTLYAPKTPPQNMKLPVLLWGNGMCSDQGLGFRNFLTEVASHGYFVVANGDPKGTGKSADTKMPKALDWIYNTAATKYPYIDKTKIVAAGQSCGGLQAYKTSTDKRITLTGIFDSGNMMGNSPISKLHAPVAYFLGGTSDMAYKSGTKDFAAVKVPTVLVNNPKGGHMQTFMDKQGGLVAQAGVAWFDWMLKNSTSGKQFLLSKSSVIGKAGWQVTTRNM